MNQLVGIIESMNYGLVTIYGFLLSLAFAGGCKSNRQKYLSVCVLAGFIVLQTSCRAAMGVEYTKKIYPLLVHLPLVLILTFVNKKNAGVSVVSVCTAYSCCQFPRWVSMAVLAITSSKLASAVSYTVVIIPIFALLYWRFSDYVYSAMTCSRRTLILFGALPVMYYVFDYATAVYTNLLYSGSYAMAEVFPTVCILLYVGLISLYHNETQNRSRAEFERSAMSMQLRQAETERQAMKMIQEQNALFRHDMRHHINYISAYLAGGNIESAARYVERIKNEIVKITPVVYTENNIVNAALSYFALKSKEKGVEFECSAGIPANLNIPDTDFGAVLSNVLENAITAASKCDDRIKKAVTVNLGIKKNKLLISVSNPYVGTIESVNGLPVSRVEGHGYGVKSIKTIVERCGGTCSFEWENGAFTTRIVISDAVGSFQHGDKL